MSRKPPLYAFDAFHISRKHSEARAGRIEEDDPRLLLDELDGFDVLGRRLVLVMLAVDDSKDAHALFASNGLL